MWQSADVQADILGKLCTASKDNCAYTLNFYLNSSTFPERTDSLIVTYISTLDVYEHTKLLEKYFKLMYIVVGRM